MSHLQIEGVTMFLSSSEVQTLEPERQRMVTALVGRTILLVDDEEMMLELGRELLEESGFRVLVARDGVEAIEMYRLYADDIDLVILDLLMPRLDGGQTFLELRKIKASVRAFFCTGYTPEDVIGSLLAGESLRAVQKPFRPKEFIRTVQEMLQAG